MYINLGGSLANYASFAYFRIGEYIESLLVLFSS